MDGIGIAAGLHHPASWQAGWALVLAGFLSGAAVGLGFHREAFLGGYASFRRRLLRLGHVALVALGVLNLLFALSPSPAAGSRLAELGGAAFLAGGVLMPAVCFLAAWRPAWRHLFFLPVLCLTTGVVTVLWG